MGKILYCMMLLGSITTSCNFYSNQNTYPLKEPKSLLKNPAKTVWNKLHKLSGPKTACRSANNRRTTEHAHEENNPEASLLDEEYHELKDSLYTAIRRNNILEIERIFNKTEAEKLLLKTKNNKLKTCLSITFILLAVSLIVLFFHIRHKRMQTECNRLNEIVKHTRWGFLVTKEFIAENRIAYDELERMLNRAKGLNNINTEFYNKFHNVLTQQKANYSGRLFNHLSNSNGSFETKFQQQFPDLNTDDFLLATMIHHQWKISDMASILHISQDAVRKRKMRLNNKISVHLKKEIDLDEYLTNF